MNEVTLAQSDVEDRLIANRLGRRAGRNFVASFCMLGKSGDAFVVWPKSDDKATGQRVKRILDDVFADAANVTVEAPVGEPKPLSA